MLKPEMVPREATEAAAVQLSNGKNTTQAIAAAINAWPGVDYRPGAKVTKTWRDPGKIILPLPTEKSDD